MKQSSCKHRALVLFPAPPVASLMAAGPMQDLGDKAKSAAEDAKGAVKDAASNVKGAAKDAADNVKGAANSG